MSDGPNSPRSGRWVAVLAAAASSLSTAATARVRKHTAGLVYGALLLALLEDFGTPSRPLNRGRQARRRRLDAERASEPEDGVAWMYTPTGGRGGLGSFARLSFMIHVADSP